MGYKKIIMKKEDVKSEILKECKGALSNPIFKGIIKRCSQMIFTVDFDGRKLTFEFKKLDFTLYKKSFKLDEKYKGSGTNIYEFSKDEILN